MAAKRFLGGEIIGTSKGKRTGGSGPLTVVIQGANAREEKEAVFTLQIESLFGGGEN